MLLYSNESIIIKFSEGYLSHTLQWSWLLEVPKNDQIYTFPLLKVDTLQPIEYWPDCVGRSPTRHWRNWTCAVYLLSAL